MKKNFLLLKAIFLVSFSAVFLPQKGAAEMRLNDWGGLVSRYQNDETSLTLYAPHLWEKGPRFGLFSGDKRNTKSENRGISIRQFLSPTPSESMIFFADLKLGEETYRTLENDSKKFRFSELGFFTGINLAGPTLRHTVVVSIGVVDRSNDISQKTISDNQLQLTETNIAPAWELWFVF